ncbi:MFS transporter [Nibrella saemangeumensis]|uniref:MFS transporter n=1 Tax=Nibrella saemangeumensis TaxID=1084526 RepID=A0ABP8NMY7_9BACT
MFRYFIIFCTFLLALLLYIDRICISVAKAPIVADLQLTEQQMGWVLSSFALGYALLQTPSGRLVDRFGPRRVLSGIVTFWSLLTALTGYAWNYVSLLIIRFAFGAGEAGAFPGMARATLSWIPMQERGLVTGINFSGSRFGAAFALPGAAWLIQAYGWRTAFLMLGVVGIGWAVAWWLLFRDDPQQHRLLSRPEKDHILAHRQQLEPVQLQTEPSDRVLQKPEVWFAMGQYFCSNFTFFFALTWLYPHIQEKFSLGAVDAGWLGSIPLLAGAFGNWFSGWLVDTLYRKGHVNSRVIPAAIGFFLSALGLLLSVWQESVGGAVFFLSIAIFGADMTLPPSWAFCLDIGKERAGEVSGTMNMAGNLGSFVTGLAFPYLKGWTGSVTPFFFVGAILNLLAAFLWLRNRRTQPTNMDVAINA